MLEFSIPKITSEDVGDTTGTFVVEPLDRGFGYTFGNSLRRVLLSSLEGAAVTSVKIEGVAHEFTTLPGVREDVTDILLNFKNLSCVLHGESPEIEVRLTKRGAGMVTAARPDPMRHHRSGRKLGRDASHRKALYANLAGALIEHGRIKTTAAKAKEVKPIAEQMITLGKRGDVHARRQALAFLRSQDVVHKLFSDVGPRFADRPGGYSRITRIGPRQGDAAEMAYLELVDYVPE